MEKEQRSKLSFVGKQEVGRVIPPDHSVSVQGDRGILQISIRRQIRSHVRILMVGQGRYQGIQQGIIATTSSDYAKGLFPPQLRHR